MYSVYETEAFILESHGRREADKIFSLYTEDFGLIKAEARGVRKMNSKLRCHLSDFSLVSVALVRGKEKWRIVAASRCYFGTLPEFIKPLLLVKRLVQGEKADPKLFSILREAHQKPFTETKLVLAILHELGYVDHIASELPQREAIILINKSIRESQL